MMKKYSKTDFFCPVPFKGEKPDCFEKAFIAQ